MSFKHKIHAIILVVIFIVSSIAFSIPIEGVSGQGLNESDAGIASNRDEQVLSKTLDITIEEARYRLHIQQLAGSLHSELTTKEAATFGDGWIEYNPNLKILEQFTTNGEEIIKPYLEKYPELIKLIEIRKVNISLEDLMQEQNQVRKMIDLLGILADTDIDVFTGTINVYVVNLENFNKALVNNKSQFPDNINIRLVNVLSKNTDAPLLGGNDITGLDLSNQTWVATTGFGVMNQYGDKFITSAGHFAQGTHYHPTTYNGVYTLNLVDFLNQGYGRTDCSYYVDVTGAHLATNIIKDSPTTTRGIVGIQNYSDIIIGEYVFKYGHTTGLTVGQVSTKSFNGSFVQMNSFSGQPLCSNGDSGGPCFVGNSAVGIVHSTITGYGCNFGSVSFLHDDLHINVMTSP
jgi:hypothetical protein